MILPDYLYMAVSQLNLGYAMGVYMLMKEACEKSKLTKKAIEYYEQNGLLHPVIGDNGYRNYSDSDVSILREIAVLRTLGIRVKDIQTILNSNNKSTFLSKIRFDKELQMQKEKEQRRWLELLSKDYNIDQFFDDILTGVDGFFSIRDKLMQAFPDTFGRYLTWHFGKFLGERIETVGQRTAYDNILNWLDELDTFRLPEELEALLEGTLDTMQEADETMSNALVDIGSYLQENKEQIEAYQKFRLSTEYKSTSAYKLQTLIIDFQKRSGYEEVFIKNMRELSPSYCKHIERLEKANIIMLEKYPQLKDLYL